MYADICTHCQMHDYCKQTRHLRSDSNIIQSKWNKPFFHEHNTIKRKHNGLSNLFYGYKVILEAKNNG